MPIAGHCLCGDIAFEIAGQPLWVVHCHCESCRRQTSSAFATFVGLKAEQLRFLHGTPAAYVSSPGVRRSFCPSCGSPISYEGASFPGEVHIHAGTLADPGAISPQGHVHVGEQLPWAEVLDDLPRYEGAGAHGAVPMRRGATSVRGPP